MRKAMEQAPAVENLMPDTFEDLAEDKNIRAAIKSGCFGRLEGRLLLLDGCKRSIDHKSKDDPEQLCVLEAIRR
jgi:hypothetical protein